MPRSIVLFRWMVLVCTFMVCSIATVEARQVRLATYGNHEKMDQVAALFMEDHPDIELIVEMYSYGEYPTKIVTMVAGGTAPDIVQTWAQYKSEWIKMGMLLDLTPFWEGREDVANSLFPFVLETAKYNGRFYGIPHDFNASPMILQNDLFDAAGIPVPYDNWTVDEFKAAAIKLTDPSRGLLGANNGVAFGGTTGWQWARNWTGQGWLTDDRASVTVDSAEHIDMLTFFIDLATHHEAIDFGRVVASRDRWGGGFAMWKGYVDYSFRLAESNQYNFRFATMPRAAHGQSSLAQGHMWSVPHSANNPEDALTVLDWMLSAKGQEAMVTVSERLPMSPDPHLWDLYFAKLPDSVRHHVQSFVIHTLYGENLVDPMSYWDSWSRVNTVMVRHLFDAFSQVEAPANAMRKAAQEIAAILTEHNH